MKNKFVEYFSKISPLTKEEEEGIEQGMCIIAFKKGTILLKEGQISIDTYFIMEGCIREYILSDGEEKTTNFFIEDQWVISMNNFGPKTRSSYNLVCVEDTKVSVVEISVKVYHRFSAKGTSVFEELMAM